MRKFEKVGVLMGGLSAEREISLQSGEAVVEALRKRGYQPVPMVADRDVDLALRGVEVDAIFNALHGRYGEDGCIQGLLELRGIPYTGSGLLASALSMNKVKAKELFRHHNLPTPPYYLVNRSEADRLAEIHGSFGFPVVVKPAGEGSSLGVSVAADLDQLAAACRAALDLDEWLIVERFIAGKEVHIGIVNGRVLGAIGVLPESEILDFQAKYTPGHVRYQVPAKLSPERYRGVETQALRAHQILGCSGASRVEMIVNDLGNEFLLEVNTAPGLTRRSVLPRIARHAGLSYEDLIEEILCSARTHGAKVEPLEPRQPPPAGGETDPVIAAQH
jgi:D-alanine-D-alanine ligase